MRIGQEFRDHLESSPSAIAHRESWNGQAYIRFGGLGLTIHRHEDPESYPYAFSFDDFAADDWEIG
jgi:hypothetical protein